MELVGIEIPSFKVVQSNIGIKNGKIYIKKITNKFM